jgi:hypothetical protein
MSIEALELLELLGFVEPAYSVPSESSFNVVKSSWLHFP